MLLHHLIWWMIRTVTDALLSRYYQRYYQRRRRYWEDAKGRWWDSRENLQVWSVASYRTRDVYRAWILHRSGFDVAHGRGVRIREARMMSPIIPWNTWAPVLRYTLLFAPPRGKVYENEHALSVTGTVVGSARRRGQIARPLRVLSASKLFSANRKNSLPPSLPPCFPQNPSARHPCFCTSLHFLS